MEHSTTKRIAKIYSIDEAQLIFDEIPSDDEITDEEPDEEEEIIPSHQLPFELLSSFDELAPEFETDPLETNVATPIPDQECVVDAPASSIIEPTTASRSKKRKRKESSVPKETAKSRSWKKKSVDSIPNLFEGQQGKLIFWYFLFCRDKV